MIAAGRLACCVPRASRPGRATVAQKRDPSMMIRRVVALVLWGLALLSLPFVQAHGQGARPEIRVRREVSPDGRVWTFVLRKGVQFHKGYGELTADDVKFSFDRFQDKTVATPNAGDWANVQKIEAPDRSTVRITLRDPSAVFVATPIASRPAMIVSRKAVLEKGKG